MDTPTEYLTPFSHLENKTKKHKNWYNPEFVGVFCKELNASSRLFDSKSLQREFDANYQVLEMKDRLKLICDLVEKHYPAPYLEQLAAFQSLLYQKWPFEEGMFSYGYHLYPISQFVERHAAKNLKASISFIEKLTQRFTGEFALRAVANADEKITLSTVKMWSQSKSFHVRRLASEGVRPRLPWGQNITWVSENPKKILPIYSRLRNDPVLYVRRSVANAMADIIKTDSALALATFEKWLSKKNTKENTWVIKHAIRKPKKENDYDFVELQKYLNKISTRF
ncbi:hypothetical protein N9D31_03830 [Oligoflexaceae bacterium]|nr:hypothetical protein [Oligoflexaceae bacterium]